jgi:hypothetical protein
MTKNKYTNRQKSLQYLNLEPANLEMNERSELFCAVCDVLICTERKSVVVQHLQSARHKEMLQKIFNKKDFQSYQ